MFSRALFTFMLDQIFYAKFAIKNSSDNISKGTSMGTFYVLVDKQQEKPNQYKWTNKK